MTLGSLSGLLGWICKGKSMGSNRNNKRVQVRKRHARPGEIIEAALAEFADHGFAATRMIDIANRAGASKGTLYRYFPDKQALFKAVITSRIAEVRPDEDDILTRTTGSSSEILTALLLRFYNQIIEGDPGVVLRILITEGRLFPELVAVYHQQVMTNGLALLGQIISRGVETGEFRADMKLDDPRVIIGPAIAAIIWQLIFSEHDPVDFETYATSHIDLILNGLRA